MLESDFWDHVVGKAERIKENNCTGNWGLLSIDEKCKANTKSVEI